MSVVVPITKYLNDKLMGVARLWRPSVAIVIIVFILSGRAHDCFKRVAIAPDSVILLAVVPKQVQIKRHARCHRSSAE